MERFLIIIDCVLVLEAVVWLHNVASLNMLTHYILSVEIPTLTCVLVNHQVVQS